MRVFSLSGLQAAWVLRGGDACFCFSRPLPGYADSMAAAADVVLNLDFPLDAPEVLFERLIHAKTASKSAYVIISNLHGNSRLIPRICRLIALGPVFRFARIYRPCLMRKIFRYIDGFLVGQ